MLGRKCRRPDRMFDKSLLRHVTQWKRQADKTIPQDVYESRMQQNCPIDNLSFPPCEQNAL